MEPTYQQITDILVRKIDTTLKEMNEVEFDSGEWIALRARFEELSETLTEISALKESLNTNATPQ